MFLYYFQKQGIVPHFLPESQNGQLFVNKDVTSFYLTVCKHNKIAFFLFTYVNYFFLKKHAGLLVLKTYPFHHSPL